MSKWTFVCWSCRQPTEMEDRVGSKEECPHCHMDMHACKNCHYYDVGAHNQCTESISEYTPDKERANFCNVYRAFQGERADPPDMHAVRAKLDALFRK